MSVPVDLDKLADALADFSFGYLITVGENFHAHTVAVDPVPTAGVLNVGRAGKGTRRNITAHPDVTLLWPPRDPGGYSLIVDGHAELSDDMVHVHPTRAVLHRKASSRSLSDSASTCGDDCVPLDGHE